MMAAKKGVPKLFKKIYTEKNFNRKILKWVYLKDYERFLRGVFVRDKEGNYQLKDGLTREEGKRLKVIAKTIKGNRGLLKTGRLVLATVLLLLILVFNFLFKDVMLTHAAEKWLQGIFAARVDLEGVRFNPFGGRIHFRELVIADRDNPFSNLLQLGSTELDLNTAALLRGRVVIDNLQCLSVRWNTTREYSGALAPGGEETAVVTEPEAGKEKSGDEEDGSEPFFSFAGMGPEIESMVGDYAEKSLAYQQLDEMQTELRGLREKWQGVSDIYAKEVDGLAANVLAVKKESAAKIDSLQKAGELAVLVEKTAVEAAELKQKLVTVRKDFLADLDRAAEMRYKLDGAVREDLEILRSFINLPAVGEESLLAAVAADYLEPRLGMFYTYGLKLLEYLQNIKTDNTAEEPAAVATGRDIYFPVRAYPRFWLRKASLSLGEVTDPSYLAVEVRDVSSAPALSGGPAGFSVKHIKDETKIDLEGALDLREEMEEKFWLTCRVADYPLDTGDKLAGVGLRGFRAMSVFDTRLVMDETESLQGEAELLLEDLVVEPADGGNVLMREFSGILEKAGQIGIDASWKVSVSRKMELVVSTTLDELIASRVGELIAAGVEDAEERLRQAFEKGLAEDLKINDSLYDSLSGVKSILDGEMADLDSYQTLLESRKKELADLQRNLENAAKKRVEEAASNATSNLKNQLNKFNPF